FILTGRAGAWAGQDWNTSVGVPTGWYYWLPPNGGNDGLLNSGFENTVVTNSTAHSGTHSLMFNMPAGRQAHDGFVGTKLIPFANLDAGTIHPGDSVRVTVWIKASGLLPDSAAAHPTTWAVGITPQWSAMYGNNDGYNTSGSDYQFVFPAVTSFDWTKYTLDLIVPAGVVALETRLHVYSTFVGTVYFDDLDIEKISTTTGVKTAGGNTPHVFDLSNNYPNPFNPSTKINYSIPKDGMVSLIVYNVLGQQVRTLISGPMTAGQYSITWDGRNNAGSTLSSGVYFYRLQANDMAIVKKMLLLK
ncbi:MAG TPA: FlgD immunoglobulin-like domain containing protein, partial [Bacteroidota bacterium]|nr:FlgD immunoglobulin-like domain containing protein [Bacteroidota bacterium]